MKKIMLFQRSQSTERRSEYNFHFFDMLPVIEYVLSFASFHKSAIYLIIALCWGQQFKIGLTLNHLSY